MESALRRTLADGTLVAVGAAIALGWALFRVANAIGTLVVSAVSAPPFPNEFSRAYPLTARVGDRVLVFGPLLEAA
ncbi:MAG: hypothetical protein ICV67_01485 [Thermoleophilia bacterium]|nr:hypothetical protein [Thermoleophilia bacterium]